MMTKGLVVLAVSIMCALPVFAAEQTTAYQDESTTLQAPLADPAGCPETMTGACPTVEPVDTCPAPEATCPAMAPIVGVPPPAPCPSATCPAQACPSCPNPACPMNMAGRMDPAMREKMMRSMQDLMVMVHNTAIATPQGVYVLQGNNLLQYSNDLQLKRTVALPLPAACTPDMMMTKSMRSMVMARIIPMDMGDILVMRGQQMVRLTKDLKVVNQAMLPDLSVLSDAEMMAVAPLGMYMQMMMQMKVSGGTMAP